MHSRRSPAPLFFLRRISSGMGRTVLSALISAGVLWVLITLPGN